MDMLCNQLVITNSRWVGVINTDYVNFDEII